MVETAKLFVSLVTIIKAASKMAWHSIEIILFLWSFTLFFSIAVFSVILLMIGKCSNSILLYKFEYGGKASAVSIDLCLLL